MENFNLLATKLSANPRLVWLIALLTMMALALAAGAPESMSCAGIGSC